MTGMEEKDFLRLENNSDTKKVSSYRWLVKEGSEEHSVRMIDMSEKELRNAYSLCMQMLYNNDSNKLGRVHVLRIIEKQKRDCTISLFLKWIRSRYKKSEYDLYETLRVFINNNETESNQIQKKPMSNYVIGDMCPEQFRNITFKEVMQACVGGLGVFNSRYITKSLIYRQGIALTKKDMKNLSYTNEELDEIAAYYKSKNRDMPKGKKIYLDIIKIRLNISMDTEIYLNPKGLTYDEFRSMIYIKNNIRYSDMTTEQLTVLRNNMLLILEEEVYKHIKQWKTRQEQIMEVAKLKGFHLL